MTRGDVIENNRLNAIFNWKEWNYEDFLWMFHDFIDAILLRNDVLKKFNISSAIFNEIIICKNAISDYLNKKINDKKFDVIGYTAFSMLDTCTGAEREILRAVQMGTGSKNRTSFEEYDAGFVIGYIVSFFYAANDDFLYKEFGNFLESHPQTQKYKNK